MYEYPFGNGQQLNLDWFLAEWKNLLAAWEAEKNGIDGALQAEIDRAEAALADVFSARDAAAQSASDADASKSAAAQSAEDASGYLATVRADANTASDAARNAAQSESNAVESAQTALASKNTAANSERNAAQSEANANSSKNAAAQSASDADASKRAAAQSAADADASKSAAANSQTAAQNAASSVEASAQQIATNAQDITNLKNAVNVLDNGVQIPITVTGGSYVNLNNNYKHHKIISDIPVREETSFSMLVYYVGSLQKLIRLGTLDFSKNIRCVYEIDRLDTRSIIKACIYYNNSTGTSLTAENIVIANVVIYDENVTRIGITNTAMNSENTTYYAY